MTPFDVTRRDALFLAAAGAAVYGGTRLAKALRRVRLPRRREFLDGTVFSAPAGRLSWRGLCQNIILLGGTGSGKSTFLRWLLPKVIRSGALLICAKAEDRAAYERIALAAGKEVLVLDGTGEGIAFFDSAIGPGVAIEDRGLLGERGWDSLTSVLSRDGKRQATGENAYFVLASRQFVRYAIDLLSLADCPVSAERILKICTWVPRTPEEARGDDFKKSFLGRLLRAGAERAEGMGLGKFYDRVEEYFTVSLPQLSDRTLGSILSEVESTGDILTRGACRRLLTGTLSPAELIASGVVVIVATPFMTQGDVGRACGAAMKFAFQLALQQREVAEDTPVWAIVCDEAQEIVNDNDAAYAAVCRSQRAPMILATQCVNGLIDKLGTEERAQVLIGNLSQRFIFNPTPATSKWVCEELIGREPVALFNASTQAGRDGEPPSASAGAGQSMDLAVRPQELFRLASGGDGTVECLWFSPGKPWGVIRIRRD